MWYYFQYLRTHLIIKRKQWLNAASFNKHADYTAFVILCQPRSGSTLLHTYLNSHTHILSKGEVLREELEKDPQAGNRENLISDHVFTPYTGQIKAVGLKLFYEYFDHPDYRNGFNQILQRKEVKVIHLIRKNRLELYVSLKTAEQTKVWSTTQPATHTPQITVEVDDYLKFVESHRKHQALFMNLFKDHAHLTISYEELTQDPQRTLLTVQKFLGVEPQNLFTLLAKQSYGPVASRISNYAEIEGRLADLN